MGYVFTRDRIEKDIKELGKIELDAEKRINLYIKAIKNIAMKRLTPKENVAFLKNFHAKIDKIWESIEKRIHTINREIELANNLLRKGKNMEFLERKRVVLNDIGEIKKALRLMYFEVMENMGRIPVEKGFAADVENEVIRLERIFEREGAEIAGL